MTDYQVPIELKEAILNGRCIAFVGAGFSAGVVPTWRRLLETISKKLGTALTLPKKESALDLELAGQRLQEKAGDGWEGLVREVIEHEINEKRTHSKERIEELNNRVRWLEQIPFKAVLTTNFDSSLQGTGTTNEIYWSVLRDEARWSDRAPSRTDQSLRSTPIVKLHGDANGSSQIAPLVLGREDYRRRVYEDQSYSNFLRAAFAGYTFLFLGVSFTDAYLNEIRSEVLKTIRPGKRKIWGYAVMSKLTEDQINNFRDYEGIEILSDMTDDFEGFNEWLKIISKETSLEGRLKSLLTGKKIVWVDPNPQNNERGYKLVAGSSGATVETLVSHAELDEDKHAQADLLLTAFGYEGPGQSHAYRVLATVNGWERRPPVIIFAAPGKSDQLHSNRQECLRRGAFEYTVEWSELYHSIEHLLGHIPGKREARNSP
jgi:hypothetical protein